MSDTRLQRVLVVDDDRVNRQILTHVLQDMCQVLLAKSGEQALSRLRSDGEIDLVLLNVQMPGMDGYEVLRRMKADAQLQTIAVIIVTGSGTPDQEELALSLGAADFLVTPIRSTIARARAAIQLQLVRQYRRLGELAERDALTGIPNRRRFDQQLAQEWQRSRRTGKPLSLVMVDVDHFKRFNDGAGHVQGDHVLRQVAAALRDTCIRPSDMAARYGGEEFAVLLPETDAEGGLQVAQRLCKAISALELVHPDSPTNRFVTASMGGSTTGAGLTSPQELIEAADGQLYHSKEGGRNRASWTGVDRS